LGQSWSSDNLGWPESGIKIVSRIVIAPHNSLKV
jgi:hypothetical protein